MENIKLNYLDVQNYPELIKSHLYMINKHLLV